MNITSPAIQACAALLLVLSSAAPTQAASQSTYANAVGICNGALPGFEGALRKRPLAIANEGSTSSIVSCTLPVDQTGRAGNTVVAVAVVNRSSALAAMSCTLVDGTVPELLGAIPPTYYIQNVAVAADAGGTLFFRATDYSLATFSIVASVSCSLPPGMEIAAMATQFDDGT